MLYENQAIVVCLWCWAAKRKQAIFHIEVSIFDNASKNTVHSLFHFHLASLSPFLFQLVLPSCDIVFKSLLSEASQSCCLQSMGGAGGDWSTVRTPWPSLCVLLAEPLD